MNDEQARTMTHRIALISWIGFVFLLGIVLGIEIGKRGSDRRYAEHPTSAIGTIDITDWPVGSCVGWIGTKLVPVPCTFENRLEVDHNDPWRAIPTCEEPDSAPEGFSSFPCPKERVK